MQDTKTHSSFYWYSYIWIYSVSNGKWSSMGIYGTVAQKLCIFSSFVAVVSSSCRWLFADVIKGFWLSAMDLGVTLRNPSC